MSQYDIAVVTPSIGRPELKRAMDSVRDQLLVPGMSVKHYVVFDGPGAQAKYRKAIPKDVVVVNLPFNTGKGGNYGHKIMGAMCSLLKENWICFLDDDNTFEPNHLKTMVESAHGKDWVFSYRNMYVDGKFFGKDTYESLGPHRVVSLDQSYRFLIDTNCYMIKRPIALSAYKAWLTGWGADRVLADYLMRNFRSYNCTFQYTVNYYTTRDMVITDYVVPIEKKPVYVFHMTPEATKKAIKQWDLYEETKSVCEPDEEPYYDPHIGQKQWQINFYLGSPFPVCNGYDAYMHAPSGSTFLFVMYDINAFPPEAYTRKDVHKILYTVESPNKNYIKNWEPATLKHFDLVITYWKDAVHPNVIYHPFVNKLNLFSSVELESLIKPEAEREDSICCVLQNRSTNGKYSIGETQLESLDYLRLQSMKNLANKNSVVVYGNSWYGTGLPLKLTKSRFLDEEYVTDLYKNHRYVYVSENTDARGYVSEKIFDALIAGCTPIYCCTETNYDWVVKEFGDVAIIMKPGEIPIIQPKNDRKKTIEILKKYSIDKLLRLVVEKMKVYDTTKNF